MKVIFPWCNLSQLLFQFFYCSAFFLYCIGPWISCVFVLYENKVRFCAHKSVISLMVRLLLIADDKYSEPEAKWRLFSNNVVTSAVICWRLFSPFSQNFLQWTAELIFQAGAVARCGAVRRGPSWPLTSFSHDRHTGCGMPSTLLLMCRLVVMSPAPSVPWALWLSWLRSWTYR
jgi:hypothetical protein